MSGPRDVLDRLRCACEHGCETFRNLAGQASGGREALAEMAAAVKAFDEALEQQAVAEKEPPAGPRLVPLDVQAMTFGTAPGAIRVYLPANE